MSGLSILQRRRIRFFVSGALLVLLMLLCFLLQGLPSRPLSIGSATPVLLLPFTVAVGMCFGEYYGAWFGLFSGLLMDTALPAYFPFNALFLLIAGCACGLLIRLLLNLRPLSALWLVCAACALYFVFYWFLFCFMKNNISPSYLWTDSLPACLYSAACMLPLYPLVRLIRRTKQD